MAVQDEFLLETLGIRELFDGVRDGLVVANARGRIILWNPAATSIFGYADHEAIGQSLDLLVPDRFKERHRAGIAVSRAPRSSHL